MKHSNALIRATVSVLAVIVLALTVFGVKQVNAASTIKVAFSQSGGTSTTYYRDPSFSLERSASWITIKTSSASAFTISTTNNTTGKGRIGYVYLKRQGSSLVTTYKVIQEGTANLSVSGSKGSTLTYGKEAAQTVTTSCNWITIYKPNDYNFRIDYSANNTGSSRTGYVYLKDGTATVTIYKITQSAATYTVTLAYGGTTKTYSVKHGQQFTFPAAPANPDGKIFEGWIMKCSTPSFVGINKPGDKVTIWEDTYFYIKYTVLYEKLGRATDAYSNKTYTVWMVQHNTAAEASFDKNHKGYDLKILDGKDCYGKPDYCIVNSWHFLDDSFKRDVCKMIVKYNETYGRTSQWNRTVTGCVDEWCEHNLIYYLSSLKTNPIPFVPWETYAKEARDVDLDADAHGYLPGSLWSKAKAWFNEQKAQW